MPGRYRQYIADYLLRNHDFSINTVNTDFLAVLDFLFEKTLTAYRLREALPRAIASERQHLTWLENSLAANPRGRKPAYVYEASGEPTPSEAARWAATLNQLEREINALCRAIENVEADRAR